MTRLPLLFVAMMASLPVFAHPGHGAPDHAWYEHGAIPAAAIALVLAWGAWRRRQGVLPLAIAIAVAMGAGTAGVGLPL